MATAAIPLHFPGEAMFDRWLRKVNHWLEVIYGLGLTDLPDCPYADWYEGGLNPKSAARRAIRRLKE